MPVFFINHFFYFVTQQSIRGMARYGCKKLSVVTIKKDIITIIFDSGLKGYPEKFNCFLDGRSLVGRMIVNVVPFPSTESTFKLPPCSLIIL